MSDIQDKVMQANGIDHNKVPSDLTRFPVMIDIFDTDLRTDVQADGDDIMFTSNGRSLR